MKKKIISLLLSVGMIIPQISIAKVAEAAAETAQDNSVLVFETFDGTTVPEGFSNTKGELTVSDGRIKYAMKGLNATDFSYDLSGLGDLDCRRVVFEYDLYPESIPTNTPRYYYTNIMDEQGKSYTNFYMDCDKDTPVVYYSSTSIQIKPWSETEKNYYKIKIRLDIENKTQSVQIAEMAENGTMSASGWQYLVKNAAYEKETDGSFDHIKIINCPAWAGTNDAISIDNFKIYKEGFKNEKYLADEDFNDDLVPERFVNKQGSGYQSNMTAQDGRLVWTSQSQSGGGVYYDLSSMKDITEQKCEKLVFEYDYYPENLPTDGRSHYINIMDKNEAKYNDFYAALGSKQEFYATNVQGSNVPITSWNISDEDTDKIYNIKMILDIINKKQTVKITAKNADGTGDSTTYTSVNNNDWVSETDGSFGKLWLVRLTTWGGENLRISFDNFKIYKEGIIEELDCTAANEGILAADGQKIRINFTNEIDKNTVSAISVEDEDGNTVEAEISVNGKTVTLACSDLALGKTYTVNVGTDILDIYGQNIGSEKTLTFKKDKNLLAYEDFDGEGIAQAFNYKSENGTTLTIENGKLVYKRPDNIGAVGGFWYDLSSLQSMVKQRCEKMVFEFDVEYRDLKLHSAPSYYKKSPVVLDANETAYLDTYIETQKTSDATTTQLVSSQGWQKAAIKAWNVSEGNENVYYKIRITIDALKSKQKFEYAEMTSESTALPNWKSFGEKAFFEEADGTLGKLYFAAPSNWANITLSLDNFKISKEGELAENVITTAERADGKVTVKVQNNKSEKVTYKSVFAVYDVEENGVKKLISVVSEDGELLSGASKTHTYDAEDGKIVKIFTWDSFAGIDPFNEAIEK